ncbi:riboflavin synthase [Helicobacter pylori]|uniref:riboflavin synthase n=1 Tax=Helicobacter pylori TaxID=210 RepID=UPI0009A2A852|nr:riboflavin synthase [Helicobacter pylori]NHB17903.1 riboflavin synthase [Helicobacter pylori]OPG45208.1 riboflavin synthase subunit alpha [Helicobacter pylori]QEF45370.1 riboflavin synthase [Helicobacter pylori]
MFSGLIHKIAKVKSFHNNILSIESDLNPKLGDSIAINGACLTAIESSKTHFSVELSQKTQNSVALENYKDLVHIEPALKADASLDGHFVQGHIDAIGVIEKIIHNANQVDFFISASEETLLLCVEQGSIAIDGVSLTLSKVEEKGFWLTIIPYTLENTLFKTYKLKRRVNIETDMLVRSVISILKKTKGLEKNFSWNEADSLTLGY